MNISNALTNRMDFLIARQGVIAGNIANADTPGYAPRDIALKNNAVAGPSFGMAVTNARHLSGGGAAAAGFKKSENYTHIQHNGNAVRLDEELMKQGETQLNYRLMTQLYTKNVGLQQLAIGRGR
jgi:flagellar basal-body rod protein FlgB